MELWTVGLALSALLVVAARDVGRPGNASAVGLLCLRAVGGLGLAAMALLALRYGRPQAAMVAALGAAPLLAGLVGSGRRRRLARPTVAAPGTATVGDPSYTAAARERRAA